MTSTIKSHLYFPNVRAKVEEYIKNCNACRLAKSKKVQCGIIPPKNEVGQLWEETAVDLMGPWEIEIINVGAVNCIAAKSSIPLAFNSCVHVKLL